jgi:serine/threonine protein kinase
VEGRSSSADDLDLRGRVNKLAAMLSSTSSQYIRTCECIGLLDDDGTTCRVGLIFTPPPKFGMASPLTLLRKIQHAKEPPLGDKFRLAQILSSSLALLQASSWLHKAFRGDNILFFEDSITEPYISGFEHAREVNMESVGRRPSGNGALDYYYHPDVVHGSHKQHDLYSLGVILLEIAWWKPLGSQIPPRKSQSLAAIREVFLEAVDRDLEAMVGSIYASVVKKCLECQWPAHDVEFTCAMSVDIVSRLGQCKA